MTRFLIESAITSGTATIISQGFNVSSDDADGHLTAATDQINADPRLGPLANNDGPTLTHALLPGSPAIDKGEDLSGTGRDQRGEIRPLDQPSIAPQAAATTVTLAPLNCQIPAPAPASYPLMTFPFGKAMTETPVCHLPFRSLS